MKTLGFALFAAALGVLAAGVVCVQAWAVAAGCGLVALAGLADLLAWATPPSAREVAEELLKDVERD